MDIRVRPFLYCVSLVAIVFFRGFPVEGVFPDNREKVCCIEVCATARAACSFRQYIFIRSVDIGKNDTKNGICS